MSRASGPLLSDAWLVAVAPGRTFDALMTRDPRGSWRRAAAPMAFSLLVFATAATIVATRVAAVPTLLSVAAVWSFITLFQLTTAWWMCHAGRRVARPRALELLFTAHLPWTLWFTALACAALWLGPGPGIDGLLMAVLVPAVWTPVLLAAFCRTVLGCSPREARRRTIVHQALTWGAFLAFAVATIQPWARYGAFQ